MIPTISLTDFIALYPEGVTLIDVREPDEYAEAHVPGAILKPLSELHRHLPEIPRDDTVYVICRSGRRSQAGAEEMIAVGVNAISVDDGTLGWIRAGQEVVTGNSPTGD
ncbi:MAG: rhodanese-like domain-containing protein [Propionibacterium sp.]|nr:rhodanese-like domain-containing protein [Propionibacterium sp.]